MSPQRDDSIHALPCPPSSAAAPDPPTHVSESLAHASLPSYPLRLKPTAISVSPSTIAHPVRLSLAFAIRSSAPCLPGVLRSSTPGSASHARATSIEYRYTVNTSIHRTHLPGSAAPPPTPTQTTSLHPSAGPHCPARQRRVMHAPCQTMVPSSIPILQRRLKSLLNARMTPAKASAVLPAAPCIPFCLRAQHRSHSHPTHSKQ